MSRMRSHSSKNLKQNDGDEKVSFLAKMSLSSNLLVLLREIIVGKKHN
jgi:hypothetical protein